MAHVHKEPELSLTHLLGMDMCLQSQIVLFTVTTVGEILPHEKSEDDTIEEVGPCRTVPGTMDDDGKLTFWRLDVITLCLDPEAIGAFGQMRERDDINARLESDEGFAVDEVEISFPSFKISTAISPVFKPKL